MELSRKQTGLISLAIVLLAIYLFRLGNDMGGTTDFASCTGSTRSHFMVGSIALFAVAVAGTCAGFVKDNVLFCAYFFCLGIMIASGVYEYFQLTSAVEGSGAHAVPNRTFLEYSLGGYSGWLVKNNTSDWGSVKNCLVSGNACASMQKYAADTAEQFFREQLTPIESGCCKPPTLCGFQIENVTSWSNPIFPSADSDCSVWNQDAFCYDCDSCRAAFFADVKESLSDLSGKLLLCIASAVVVGAGQLFVFRTSMAKEEDEGKEKSNTGK